MKSEHSDFTYRYLTRKVEHPTDVHELLFELAPRSGSPVTQQWPAQQFLRRLPDVPPIPEAAVCYGNNRLGDVARREGVHLKNDLRRCGTQNAQGAPNAASGWPLCHSISARFAGGRTVGTRALPTDLGREASSVDTESSTPLKLPVAAPHSSTPEP